MSPRALVRRQASLPGGDGVAAGDAKCTRAPSINRRAPTGVRERDSDRGLGRRRAGLESGLWGDEQGKNELIGVDVHVGREYAAIGPLTAGKRLLADEHPQDDLVGLRIMGWVKAPGRRAEPVARGPQRSRRARPKMGPGLATGALLERHREQLGGLAAREQDLAVGASSRQPSRLAGAGAGAGAALRFHGTREARFGAARDSR